MQPDLILHPAADGAPGPRNGPPHYQPELDGIRGLAILGVLVSHAADLMRVLPLHGPHHLLVKCLRHVMVPGWGGVDLFFTLSGFLITGILLRGRTGPRYFRNFYARRVLRIFPIYYLCLTVSALAVLIAPNLQHFLPYGRLQTLSFFLYLQNWPVFWKGWGGLVGLWGSYWSLAVEEQFYFVWPTMVRRVRPEWLLGACIFGFLVQPFGRVEIAHHLTGWSLGLLHFPTARLDGLFLGAAIALYREIYKRKVPLAWAGMALGAGAAGLMVIAAVHPYELVGTNSFMESFGISAFALLSAGLLAASQHRIGWLYSLLSGHFLRFFGKYSYGMYVYHLALFVLVMHIARTISPRTAGELPLAAAIGMIVLAVALTCGVAFISYQVIEQPVLRLKRFFPSAAETARAYQTS